MKIPRLCEAKFECEQKGLPPRASFKIANRRKKYYNIAIITGWLYMLVLIGMFYFLQNEKPDNKIAIFTAIAIILPVILILCFSAYAKQNDHFAYYITGIPAIFAILAQYILWSFIPNVVRPPGVMIHIIGPAGPFDLLGQITQALPILIWAILIAFLGLSIARIMRHIRQKYRTGRCS